MLLLFYGFSLLRRGLPKINADYLLLDAAIGLGNGVLGALAGLSGVLPTVWASMKPWPKLKIRALLQPHSIGVLSISAIAMLFPDAFTETLLLAFLLAVPVSLIASQIGVTIFKRLLGAHFKYC